jgi:hypothetical protein
MKSSLATFFHAHQNVEAWWHKVKTTPKTPLHAAQSPLEPLDEAPGEFCLSKLLGITMNELWEALFRENLAKKRGQLCLIDREQMQEFIILMDLLIVFSSVRAASSLSCASLLLQLMIRRSSNQKVGKNRRVHFELSANNSATTS